MKQIQILFIKYSDCVSNLLYFIGNQEYTHCSIGLEEEPNQFYSFNYKGFAIESIERHKQNGINDLNIIQIQVTDEKYQKTKALIKRFITHQDSYCYTRLGLLFCICHISIHWKYAYFYSQFVTELLIEAEVSFLSKTSYQYFPNQLRNELTNSLSI